MRGRRVGTYFDGARSALPATDESYTIALRSQGSSSTDYRKARRSMALTGSQISIQEELISPVPTVDDPVATSESDAPFIVGVSGHRDIDPSEMPRVRAAIIEFLQQIRACLPDTEIRVTTGMASGADLLVAGAALDLGLGVDAMLPLPLQRYAADFEPSAFLELERLLAQPNVRCTELSLTSEPEPGRAFHGGVRREDHYLNLTRMLIKSCHLLLAVWDGEPSVLPGGTADTVLRYLGLRSDRRPQDSPVLFSDAPAEQDPDSRLVYWIPTVRSGSSPGRKPAAPCYLSGLGEDVLQRWASMPRPLHEQLAELNAYNREYHRIVSRGARPAADSLMRSLSSDVPLPRAARPWLERIDAQYGKADSLALHFQVRSDRLFVFFTVTTFLMGLAYLAYDKFVANRMLLFVYLIVLLSGLGLYLLLNGRQWFGKHLMYRALAETLRAKFYLSVAGADHLVDAGEVISLCGINRFHGFGWIAHVLTGLGRPADGVTAGAHDPCLDGVEAAWIESQRRYFVRKVERLERSGRRTRLLKRFLFAIILLVIAGLIVLSHAAGHLRPPLGVRLERALTFVLGLPALVLGVWELHQNKMAMRELLWQYRHQLDHFSRARTKLAKTSSAARRRQVLAKLGKDSLMESYLWTIHRYHREHEPGRG